MRAARLTLACAVVLVGLLSASLPGVPGSAPALAASPAVALPTGCESAPEMARRWGADVSRVASDRLVKFDGRWVSLTPEGWRAAYDAEEIRSPSWALWFRSLIWVVRLAVDDASLAVRLVLDQAAAVPDPGSDARASQLVATGWTPGAIRNRLNIVRCVYLITGDPQLVPVAVGLGDALMSPGRYSGWPRSAPHNHGALTSLALLRAAQTFDRPAWAQTTMRRLKHDLPKVFSACGMANEQSSGYQALNVSLWGHVARLLRYRLTRPSFALAALVRPDGVLEAIGDGKPSAVHPNGERLWCPLAGWAANTLRGKTHYVLRFGPATRLHGHSDHGAITWFVRGVPVLSDRGLYDKTRDERLTYARGMAAHSVLEPLNAPMNPATEGKRVGSDQYRLRDDNQGIARERVIKIAPKGVAVTDTATSWNYAQEWIQHWQLAPGWTPTRTGARYTDGTRLTLTCQGGTMQAVAVESYPGWRQIESAWDLQCRAVGSTIRLRTTLEVS